MSYLISLDLPLWVAFIPLLLAALLAYKLYQWQGIFLSVKANYQVHLREVQNRLEDTQKHRDTYENESIERLKAINQLKAEAAEHEALIAQLNSNIEAHLSHIDELIETIGNLDQERKSLQADLAAAIAVINRTKRATKQWVKHQVKKSGEAVQKAIEKLQSNSTISKTESVVYDSIGVPTVVKADQSENDNGRHDVLSICNEVNRGIAEQAKAIKMEIAKTSIKFDPQVGELVKLVDLRGEFKIVEISSNKNGYLLTSTAPTIARQFRFIQDLRPIIGKTYQNGYKKTSNTCYKEPNKTCIYDCDGLCKNS